MEKFNEYNMDTVFDVQGKPPVIRIETGKNARINFSVEAVKLLNLEEGMRISFRFYPQDPGIVYFYEDKKGIPLAKQFIGKSGIRLALYCRPLAAKLLKDLAIPGSKITIDLQSFTVIMPGSGKMAWMIDKKNIHQPIKWRKK